jgi:hypothetical protein
MKPKRKSREGGPSKVFMFLGDNAYLCGEGQTTLFQDLLHSKVFEMERYISKSLNSTTLFEGA